MQLVVLVLGLDFPAMLSLLDCFNRPAEDFEAGADDRAGWLRWLAVSLALCPIMVGYGIVLAYYYRVVRRNTPMRA